MFPYKYDFFCFWAMELTLGRCLLWGAIGEYMLTLSLEYKIRMARQYMATIEAMWFQRTLTIIILIQHVNMMWSVVLRISSPYRTFFEQVGGFVCFKRSSAA